MNDEVVLSVIIPVYNRENDIKELLFCFLKQQDSECELILVNDGSSDNSYNICLELQKEFDMPMQVLNKKNGGASSARNVGLLNAKGKYVCFVDSDDRIDDDYLTQAKKLCFSNYDLYQMNYKVIDDMKKNVLIENSIPYGEIELSRYFEYILEQKSNPPWSKIFKTEIIRKNNIKFDTGLIVGEDISFTLMFLEHCHNCYVSDIAVYRYYINPNGLCGNVKLEYLSNNDKLFRQMEMFINKMQLSDKHYYVAMKMMMRSYFRYIGYLVKDGISNIEIEEEVRKSDSFRKLINFKYSGSQDKIRRFLLRNKMYTIIAQIVKKRAHG